MANLNKVLLIGNITRDIELRYTPKGTAVCDFGLAINRVFSVDNEKREEVTFVDVSMFGKLAEIVAEYKKKGDSLFVEGRLSLDSWEDKQTGQKRSRLKVIAESVQFIGGKRTEGKPQEPEAGESEGDDSIPF